MASFHSTSFRSSSAFHPSVRTGRLAAGLLAGLTAGVVLGFPMSAMLIVDAEALLGPMDAATFWGAHLLASMGIGLAYSAFFAPRGHRAAIGWSVAGVMAVVWGGGELVRAMMAGAPPAIDMLLWLDAAGHLAFAITLGVTYVAYHRTIVKDAAASPSLRWRAWARAEERSACR